ncbi:uncharacterized protein LOC112567002 [Pomacea canaliculata]|uniref:uncharacterized protein LOC112567002 n=1 Tax=Pomacea canaliculata TaxID=400727 RepID=UPI000D7300D2|nr:uncharacterized protein LOC112567002 [Pomacea canaliculata]
MDEEMDFEQGYYPDPNIYDESIPPSTSSDDDDDEEEEEENSDGKSIHHNVYSRTDGSGDAYHRFHHTHSLASCSEEDANKSSKELSDPGPFRYNKRVFVTSLPCLLLLLIVGGETFLLIVTLGTMLVVMMAHIGENVSKRCVMVFILLFIPCHILIVATVFPLVWLSIWNIILVGLVNTFMILTGGWIIIQFSGFRKEEPGMCATIEQLLFSIYPLVCSAIITWILSSVTPPALIAFAFVSIWFVCLQLYLLPVVSSFKQTETADEDMNVLQIPFVICIVVAFIFSGPILHIVVTLFSVVSPGLFSASSLVQFFLLGFLGIFLSTLLNLRQICDHLGCSHMVIVRARWLGGAGVTLLCYPVLQMLGSVSHFLPWLPVAIVAFSALGLTLAYKKSKMLTLLLIMGLVLLLCLWLSHLPWGISYNFLSVISIQSFYGFVAINFLLCLLIIFCSWHGSKEILGLLIVLQSVGITTCEIALYRAELYSGLTFNLTGVLAAYTLYRLYVAEKLTRNCATIASALHLTKTASSTFSYLVMKGTRDAHGMEVSLGDMLTLMLLVGMLVWLFVYEAKDVTSAWQAVRHLSALLLCLAISGQSFLLPVGRLLLQKEPTISDLVALWYGCGGVFVLLYALQHSQTSSILEELLKLSAVLIGVAVVVMVLQPQFLLCCLTQILVSASILGICPGIRLTLMFYGEDATIPMFVLLTAISFILLALTFITVKVQEVSDYTETFLKIGTGSVLVLLTALIGYNIFIMDQGTRLRALPAWRISLGAMLCISVSLKILAVRLGPGHLPLTKKEDHSLPLIPVIGNLATAASFLFACTQGPEDGLLHDMWCCAASLVLICLQRDAIVLSNLSSTNKATPIIVTSIATLVVSTLLRCRLWAFRDFSTIFLGILEMLAVLLSLPVYVVLAGILWLDEVWSEKAVVFTLPMNALVFLLGSSFTAWALAGAGMISGVGMMMYRLPLVPFVPDDMQR